MEKRNATMLAGEFLSEMGVLWAALGALEAVIDYKLRGANLRLGSLLLWLCGCLGVGTGVAFVGAWIQIVAQRRLDSREDR